MGWAKNGASAGTAGYSKRLEGIEIKVVPKGSAAPGSTENSFKDKNEILPTGVIISGSDSIEVGSSATLTAAVVPSNAADKTVTWSSSDATVATVSSAGIVTGVKGGTVTITAKTSNGKTATKAITVVVPVTELTITGRDYVDVDGSINLTVKVTPTDATDKTVAWSSSDTALATVNSSGDVTGVKAGKVTITAKSSNGITATKKITVVKDQIITITLADGTTKSVVGHYDGDYAQELVSLVNAYRTENGLKAYAFSSTLDSVASIRAYELVVSHSHQRPDSSSLYDMAPGISGENFAVGYYTAEAALYSWKNSEQDDNNILSSSNTKMAAGVFAERFTGAGYVQYYNHWVLIFGTE